MQPTGMQRGFFDRGDGRGTQYVIGIPQETTEQADLDGFLVRVLPTTSDGNRNYDPNPDNAWGQVLPTWPGDMPGVTAGKAYWDVKSIIERYLRGEDIRGARFTQSDLGTFEIGYLNDPNWFGEGWYIMPVDARGIVNKNRRFPIRFQGKHFFEHGQRTTPPRYALYGPTQSHPHHTEWDSEWMPSEGDARRLEEADELTLLRQPNRVLAHIPDGATREEAIDILQDEIDWRQGVMNRFGRFLPQHIEPKTVAVF